MKSLEALEILKRNHDNATQILRNHEIDGEVTVFPSMLNQFNTIKTDLQALDKIREAMKCQYNYGTKEKVYDTIKQIIEGVK